MAGNQRLAELLREARELPRPERGDLVRLVWKEDGALAAQLEALLEEEHAPNGDPPRESGSEDVDDTRALLLRLAGRGAPALSIVRIFRRQSSPGP